MKLKLNGKARIDNLRNYPIAVVDELRALLAAGAKATPDPRRRGFYDIENDCRRFFIHTAPSGNVWLLASWRKQVSECVETPLLVAVECA